MKVSNKIKFLAEQAKKGALCSYMEPVIFGLEAGMTRKEVAEKINRNISYVDRVVRQAEKLWADKEAHKAARAAYKAALTAAKKGGKICFQDIENKFGISPRRRLQYAFYREGIEDPEWGQVSVLKRPRGIGLKNWEAVKAFCARKAFLGEAKEIASEYLRRSFDPAEHCGGELSADAEAWKAVADAIAAHPDGPASVILAEADKDHALTWSDEEEDISKRVKELF